MCKAGCDSARTEKVLNKSIQSLWVQFAWQRHGWFLYCCLTNKDYLFGNLLTKGNRGAVTCKKQQRQVEGTQGNPLSPKVKNSTSRGRADKECQGLVMHVRKTCESGRNEKSEGVVWKF